MNQHSYEEERPVVLLTGAAGAIGTALTGALQPDYRVVGLDLDRAASADDSITLDLTSEDSVELALRKVSDRQGRRIASVIHLAAYYDFTGTDHPLYEAVNIEGTRRLLRHLQSFSVQQFVYSGTMLVHEAGRPGEHIDEAAPVGPGWAYPQSKAAAERVIEEEHGDIPYLLLRLAGVYDDRTAVPTLSHQIARIYERSIKSRLYAGDLRAGQAFVHKQDMVDAFRRAVDQRNRLPPDTAVLIGEPDAVGYAALQDEIGRLIHDEEEWQTVELPRTLAKAGARLEEMSEPVVPDSIDRG